jgi:hypothetical protein
LRLGRAGGRLGGTGGSADFKIQVGARRIRMRSRSWMGVALSLLLGLSVGKVVRAQEHHDHDRFDDHDRAAAHDWYHDHHTYFRHDEGRYWHGEWEPNIHEGFVFTPEMRRAFRPVPHELLVRLGPAPHGWRYVVIGDHVCLVDADWRIHDVLHFELNL